MKLFAKIKNSIPQHKKVLVLLSCAIVVIVALAVLAFVPSYSTAPLPIAGLSEEEYSMAQAFAEIGKSNPADGYPVGAVVVRDGKIIGRSFNRLFATNNPTQHAEYRATDNAIRTIQRQYPQEKYPDFFRDATVYVTLEPCPMDAGKLTILRFKRVVYCDIDEKWGGFGTVSSPQGFPYKVAVEQSMLPLCQQLRSKPGWNFPELWDIGKSYTASTNQIPSKLSSLFHEIFKKF